MFSYEFCEISKNTLFTEHLWTTAPVKRAPYSWNLRSTWYFSAKYRFKKTFSSTLNKYKYSTESDIKCFCSSQISKTNYCNTDDVDFYVAGITLSI